MIESLVSNGRFPESRITDYSLDGYGLVIEHENIYPVTYPYEWTFELLKDAALAVLETNLIAQRYGYETVDAHGFNVLFDGSKLKFIDLALENPDQ